MAFCFQTSQCRKTSHLDMQLLVSSQMEAGMEEVLDEIVGPMMKSNNRVQGSNIRQAGQGAPPGNGVCTVCTIRYTGMTQNESTMWSFNFFCFGRWDTMDESDQRRWKVTPRQNASNSNFFGSGTANFASNNQDSFTTCGFCYETHWNRRQQRLELPYN